LLEGIQISPSEKRAAVATYNSACVLSGSRCDAEILHTDDNIIGAWVDVLNLCSILA
jgi:hypothetical protein